MPQLKTNKLIKLDELLYKIKLARTRGEKIVFTNGCFDILHAGHVIYLNKARAKGNRLIVGINDDASVKRIKNNYRPINSLQQRIIVLSGLEVIDWIISFSENSPENLLHIIKPDLLVKGGDYSPDQVVGENLVKSYGGKVYVVKLVEDCSTSAIINKILISMPPPPIMEKNGRK